MFFDDITQLLTVPHVCVQSMEYVAACLVIVAIWHSTNYNHESCILQYWDVTSCSFAHTLSQIHRQLLVSLPSLLPPLPQLSCTFPQTHVHPLLPNRFVIVKIFESQPGLESLHQICNYGLRLQGFISQLFQRVLSRDNGTMLLLEKLSHPYLLPLNE
jgi:hypothetical protein